MCMEKRTDVGATDIAGGADNATAGKTRALVAMSGGVDSSVAAYLVREAGLAGIGCTMKLYDNEDAGIPREHSCCSLDDVEDARAVSFRLGMQHYVFNFRDEFETCVIGNFIREYESGKTPNPCIDCNRFMKFGLLFDRAEILGCRYVVTGHYARIEKTPDGYLLKKALDDTKDQSYVLYDMTQEQLAKTLFPLGELRKTEVRAIAEREGFLNARKPDSQDICFVPDGDYAKVIVAHTGRAPVPGDFVDTAGNRLGTHRGIIYYTIGQRRGLGIAAGEPLYVVKICPETNEVVLGRDTDLYTREAHVGDVRWILGAPPRSPFRCRAKTRYRQPERDATLTVAEDGTVTLLFDEPQRAVTPGQAAVFYDGDTVLGGGKILG